MNSCIYRGTVRHRRRSPAHEFTYPLFMMYLELEELPKVFARRWLWSARVPAPAWFRRADYLGDRNVELSEAVRAEAERLTGRRPEGPIRVLTHLRYLGFVMNPVTFYYCFAADGIRVDTILAEITNTPWKERHVYALSPQSASLGSPEHGSDPARDSAGTPTEGPHRFAKAFHVSPFMPMQQDYVWYFNAPGRGLSVHMENHGPEGRVFDATLTMRREKITGASLGRALVRFPWMTARVAVGIYWQALRLRLKRAPYHEHPARLAA